MIAEILDEIRSTLEAVASRLDELAERTEGDAATTRLIVGTRRHVSRAVEDLAPEESR